MGLAIVNTQTCLPFANREACQLCVDECVAAGYDAIEFIQVNTQVDEMGIPQPDTGFLAPVVLADKCVGCGLCQTRCYGINVESKGMLGSSAIVIETGIGREDRLMAGVTDFPINLKTGFRGSYWQMRIDEEESRQQCHGEARVDEDEENYLPDFLK
jgi:ferredoxin